MVLTEAAGDAELVPWDEREFGHPRFITGVTSKFPISRIGSKGRIQLLESIGLTDNEVGTCSRSDLNSDREL